MALTSYDLEEVLEELENVHGRHTELISVYIAAGYDVNSVQKQLEAEKSTAKNIKSTATRKNVIESLDKIVRFLKEFKQTPENGMAVFAGNNSDIEGQGDIQLWSIEPPLKLKIRLYRCDKEFVLEPLREQLEVDEIFGLLVMDRKEATVGYLEGKRIAVVQKMTSGIPSKVRAGGQCLSPESIIETKSKSKKLAEIKVGDEIKALDLESNKIVFTKVKNKWEVIKEKYLEIKVKDCWPIIASEEHTFFKWEKNILEVLAKDLKEGDDLISFDQNRKIFPLEIKEIRAFNKNIGLIDIETEERNFFSNGLLVHNSSQRFHRITEGLTRDFYKRIAGEMKKAFFEDKRLKGILVGGPVPTKDEFLDGDYLTTQLGDKVIGRVDIGDTDESGLKELVEKGQDLISDQEIVREKKLLENFFETLGRRPDFAAYKKEGVDRALQYGAVKILLISKNYDKIVMKELKKKAEEMGTDVEIISIDTDEGLQFKNIGGLGAVLRYKV